MTEFSQVTNSRLCSGRSFAVTQQDTSAGCHERESFQFDDDINPTKKAAGIIPHIEDPAVAQQVVVLLSSIYAMTNLMRQRGYEFFNLPQLHASKDEDGSVIIQWIFPDFRIGFNLESNPSESGWHLISSSNLNGVTWSSQLTDVQKAVSTVLEFVISNT